MQGLPGLIADSRPASWLVFSGLVLAVTLAHFWLLNEMPLARLGEGSADGRPQRFQVLLRRELAPSAPPVPAAATQPAPLPSGRRSAPAAVPAQVAEAADVAASAALPDTALAAPSPTPTAAASADLPLPAEPTPAASAASAATAVATAAATAVATSATTIAADIAASAPTATAFEWPPSTRLSYRLSGNYRGPVQGQAQVEWLRSGTRYQVHMTVSVGPAFAPLLSRRITSEGDITELGLRPRRYDEETKAVLRDARRLAILFDSDSVRLPSGQALPRPEGVQDSASQFVQLTWLFTRNPAWLQTGRAIEMPLALPRQVEAWTYEVLQPETLQTPAGPLATMHVKPRREVTAARPGADLAAEIWVAPTLQYLPVRIVIRQDAENFIDLLLDRLPQQAEPGR